MRNQAPDRSRRPRCRRHGRALRRRPTRLVDGRRRASLASAQARRGFQGRLRARRRARRHSSPTCSRGSGRTRRTSTPTPCSASPTSSAHGRRAIPSWYPKVRRRPPARARARRPGLPCGQRARRARPLPSSIRRRARTRRAGARAQPRLRPNVRRDRRRACRARSLPRRVRRVRPMNASAPASPPTRASRTGASCSAIPPRRSAR